MSLPREDKLRKLAGTQKVGGVGKEMPFLVLAKKARDFYREREDLLSTLLLIEPLPVFPPTPRSDEGPLTLFLEACQF